MDKITASLAAAFGVGVSFWSFGVALTVEKIVQCLNAEQGWALFTFPDWQLGAFAAVFAGPVALLLRHFGLQPPAGADHPPAAPAAGQPQE